MSKAVFAGSFDPITNGHLDIIKRAYQLFDKLYIVIGVNANKKRSYDSELMKCAIERTLNEQGVTNTDGEPISTSKASSMCRQMVEENRLVASDVSVKGKGKQKAYTVIVE